MTSETGAASMRVCLYARLVSGDRGGVEQVIIVGDLWGDESERAEMAPRGLARASLFSWDRTARIFRAHYRRLTERRLTSADLVRIQRRNWDLLDTIYRWDRFANQLIDAIESRASPPLGREGLIRRTNLLANELTSPIGPVRRRASTVRGRVGRVGRMLAAPTRAIRWVIGRDAPQ